jgi:hypothetical protein
LSKNDNFKTFTKKTAILLTQFFPVQNVEALSFEEILFSSWIEEEVGGYVHSAVYQIFS